MKILGSHDLGIHLLEKIENKERSSGHRFHSVVVKKGNGKEVKGNYAIIAYVTAPDLIPNLHGKKYRLVVFRPEDNQNG